MNMYFNLSSERASAGKKMFLRIGYICVMTGALALSSCKKDKPEETPAPAPQDKEKGVFIINEGGFQKSNGSVSYYNPKDGSVSGDLFMQKNNRPLGDVVQSMSYYNNKAYVVINNSNKIEVVDLPAFQSLGVISGLVSPRHLAGISASKAYVTDMYGNSISVVDLGTNTVNKKINCGGSTEELLVTGDKAYVTNSMREYLYILNTVTDQLEDSIQIGYSSNSIRQDKEGKLWVLCAGNGADKKGGLYRINPSTKAVEINLEFAGGEYPWKLRMNSTKDTLYYLNNNVYKLPVTATTLPTSAFIMAGGRSLYGLGIEPGTGVVYVSDAADFSQKGTVFRYKSDGTLINSFVAGIIPSDFYFYQF